MKLENRQLIGALGYPLFVTNPGRGDYRARARAVSFLIELACPLRPSHGPARSISLARFNIRLSTANGASCMTVFTALRRLSLFFLLLLSLFVIAPSLAAADAPPLHRGYYSDPAIHGDTIIFTAE